MKRLSAWLAAALMCALFWWASLSLVPSPGGSWRDRPPSRMQSDTFAAVFFTTEGEVQRRCPMTGGQVAVGCTVGGVIYVPNPCRWRDPYAGLLCHEVGHINGWTARHEP